MNENGFIQRELTPLAERVAAYSAQRHDQNHALLVAAL
jgi:hypothetical protein